VWEHQTTGDVKFWWMNGTAYTGTAPMYPGDPGEWRITALPDLNSDGRPDIIWRHVRLGWIVGWLMNGRVLMRQSAIFPGDISDQNWHMQGHR
jgi:hypothetical protein